MTFLSEAWSLAHFRVHWGAQQQRNARIDPLSHKGHVAMAICDGSSSQQWHLEG